ncbi:MAG TPA: bifunctional adenosylcobinamide kinase/adenosylcobinamide-phosphate guanylyltransferase [bacterium]|nr:bifunctional adenosylcobinamide kinase/adenosylcobinamide-phosphate guanylyltransferase [bacterium]
MNSHLQLILGGARSGKSHYALHEGNEDSFKPKVFLATATAQDEEMARRIDRHRAERGFQWETLEEPYDILRILKTYSAASEGLLVMDCATLWISNLLCGLGGKALKAIEIEDLFKKFIQTLPGIKGHLRIISNEVGLGIVPESALGREFRDLQGRFNQSVASVADEVIFMVAGIPQKIK